MAEEAGRLLELIQEYGGDDAVEQFLRERGGVEIYVVASPKPDYWLSKLVGLDNARKICAEFRTIGPDGRFAGMRTIAPTGRRLGFDLQRRAGEKLLKQGLSTRLVALRLGVAQKTVKRWKASIKKMSRTP